jgi:hypothetical protein
MQDPFVGTWKLNLEKSEFDANHQPRGGTMVVELDANGFYTLKAEGIDQKGEAVAEMPIRFVADGQEHPIPALPGLKYMASKPDARTMTQEARKEDGTVVGGSTTVLSEDGNSKTVSNFGYDSQLRQFKLRTVWERV